MQVKKRDGTLVAFNKEKIVNAINRAFVEVDGMIYEDDTANDIADEIYKLGEISEKADAELSVEHIQDLIEEIKA